MGWLPIFLCTSLMRYDLVSVFISSWLQQLPRTRRGKIFYPRCAEGSWRVVRSQHQQQQYTLGPQPSTSQQQQTNGFMATHKSFFEPLKYTPLKHLTLKIVFVVLGVRERQEWDACLAKNIMRYNYIIRYIIRYNEGCFQVSVTTSCCFQKSTGQEGKVFLISKISN